LIVENEDYFCNSFFMDYATTLNLTYFIEKLKNVFTFVNSYIYLNEILIYVDTYGAFRKELVFANNYKKESLHKIIILFYFIFILFYYFLYKI
jgi:hypothetical protein